MPKIELSSLLAFYVILLYNSIYLGSIVNYQFIVCLFVRLGQGPYLIHFYVPKRILSHNRCQ